MVQGNTWLMNSWELLLLSCAKSHMLSASRRQPHLLHVSAVDCRQTWSMDKSWRCATGRQASTFTMSSLLLPLGVNKWCHQLTESMIPVKEPRKNSWEWYGAYPRCSIRIIIWIIIVGFALQLGTCTLLSVLSSGFTKFYAKSGQIIFKVVNLCWFQLGPSYIWCEIDLCIFIVCFHLIVFLSLSLSLSPF